MEQPGRQRCPGHRDWAKPKIGNEGKVWSNLEGREAEATEACGQTHGGNEGKLWNKRDGKRSPGHRDCAKPKLGMRESYRTTGAAEMPKPPRLGQTYAGIERKLWNNRGGRDAEATETGPHVRWEKRKLWANGVGGKDAQATEFVPHLGCE